MQRGTLLSRIIRRMRGPALLAIIILTSISVPHARPQDQAARKALAVATAADHQDMMARLGIRQLRPGPSGNESAPNHANYDEALANPYPILPDVLTLANGRKVTSAHVWKTERRSEIVELFEREVVGRIPRNVPKVTWSATATEEWSLGSHSVIGRQLVGHVANSSFPSIAHLK
jgi:hypothetical protein